MSIDCVMKDVFEFMNEKHKSSNNEIVLLAVEFDPNGYPITQSCKISGNPSAALAGLQMISKMVKEQTDKVLEGIDSAGEMSGKLDKLVSELGFEDPKFLAYLDSNDKGGELKNILAKLKSKFGK